jgi:hypothetical protein
VLPSPGEAWNCVTQLDIGTSMCDLGICLLQKDKQRPPYHQACSRLFLILELIRPLPNQSCCPLIWDFKYHHQAGQVIGILVNMQYFRHCQSECWVCMGASFQYDPSNPTHEVLGPEQSSWTKISCQLRSCSGTSGTFFQLFNFGQQSTRWAGLAGGEASVSPPGSSLQPV